MKKQGNIPGIIATFTPGKLASKPIPRITVTSDDIKKVGKIDIKNFHFQHTGDFKELVAMRNTDLTTNIDLLYSMKGIASI